MANNYEIMHEALQEIKQVILLLTKMEQSLKIVEIIF